MTDTYKERSSDFFITRRSRLTELDISSGDTVFDSGVIEDTDSVPLTNYYRTTERNLKKNGGKGISRYSPMSWKETSIDTGKKRVIRVFRKETRKWDSIEEPIFEKRITRNNANPSQIRGPDLEVNDLIHFTTNVDWASWGVDPDNPDPFALGVRRSDTFDGTKFWSCSGDPKQICRYFGVDLISPESYTPASLEARYASDISRISDIAIRKLKAAIKNQPADLGTDIAEGRKTIQMFIEYSTRLAKFLSSLRKGKISRKTISDLLPLNKKKLANDFLAYRYGVSPLIQDLSGMYEDIRNRMDDVFHSEASGRAKDLIVSSEPLSDSVTDGFLRREVRIIVKYKVFFGVDNTFLNYLNRQGLTNPLNVAWELVPFSFVVDWFIPIGPFLNQLDSMNHLTVKSVHRTVLVFETLQFSGILEASVAPLRMFADQPYSWVVQNTSVTRSRIPFVPDMPLPAFKNPLSGGHVANAVALITQLLNRGKS